MIYLYRQNTTAYCISTSFYLIRSGIKENNSESGYLPDKKEELKYIGFLKDNYALNGNNNDSHSLKCLKTGARVLNK